MRCEGGFSVRQCGAAGWVWGATWVCLVWLALAGCASRCGDGVLPPAGPLGRDFPIPPAVGVSSPKPDSTGLEGAEPSGPLDLRQALALALCHNPELSAFSWEVRAAEARELQSRLLPNPEAAVDVENVGGNMSGFRESETTVSLAQDILFWLKRSRAMRVAAAETRLAAWAFEGKRLDVFCETVQAFVLVLGAQEQVRIAQETLRIAQQVLTAASKRVEAGDAPAVEEMRASVAEAQARTELNSARQQLEAARIRLTSAWGSAAPTFTEAVGTLECRLSPPPLPTLQQRLAQNPELLSAAGEVVKRQAALEWERSKRVPDVSAIVGYRRLEGEDANTFVFGFSAPLPLFDRNQGNVREARANLARARFQQKQVEVQVQAALAEAYSELTFALEERRAFAERILPAATEAFQKTQQGYQQGSFDYLELLTAQETLARTRASHLNVLVRLNVAIVKVERLIGEPIVPAAGSVAPTDASRKEKE